MVYLRLSSKKSFKILVPKAARSSWVLEKSVEKTKIPEKDTVLLCNGSRIDNF